MKRINEFEDAYSRFKPTSILSKLNLEKSLYSPPKELLVSPELITIQKDMSIDLGGLGKGWLIDKLSDLLRNEGYKEFLINGGGDMYVSSTEKQECYIEHPRDTELVIG